MLPTAETHSALLASQPVADHALLARAAWDRGTLLIDVPSTAPTLALTRSAHARTGPGALSHTQFFFADVAPGLLMLEAGVFLWTRLPGRPAELLLRRARSANTRYPDRLIEPSMPCAAPPLETMRAALSGQVLLIALGEEQARMIRPRMDYDDAFDLSRDVTAGRALGKALAHGHLRLPRQHETGLMHAPPLDIPCAPVVDDLALHQPVSMTIAGRPHAHFRAISHRWQEEGVRAVTLRRSLMLDLPAWTRELVALDPVTGDPLIGLDRETLRCEAGPFRLSSGLQHYARTCFSWPAASA
ncbi:hypothetical protein CKO28_01030 [Rhodovibrio sodomensis]|uniref:Hedgehog/Intein (Hint) domain-containing protein n=1 Tax=Rhodovibrio sodomensis TaxID=1088 RepID=A0ABS1D9H4_9PROT|nr:hypothetical protein [Rhodovibrio sodomensis]MBK1666626.1 hypothetical protein [Rhodovibrio sodomensis]